MKYSHNFLGESHIDKEWRTWGVIILCTMSMFIEITCGIMFGSLALVSDGIHMGTHVLAFLVTASAYTYARIHVDDPKFVFSTGKVGELASFTCAILLAVVSVIIVYEGIEQLINPVQLDFYPALMVSFVGLTVNIISGMLLIIPCCSSAGTDTNSNGTGHIHIHGQCARHGQLAGDFSRAFDMDISAAESGNYDFNSNAASCCGQVHNYPQMKRSRPTEACSVKAMDGTIELSIFQQDGVPPEFRVRFLDWKGTSDLPQLCAHLTVRIIRTDGSTKKFWFTPHSELSLRSMTSVSAPHRFRAEIHYFKEVMTVTFSERSDSSNSDDDGSNLDSSVSRLKPLLAKPNDAGDVKQKYEQDNNFRAAVLHVLADAFVSVLTIIAIAVAGTVPGAWFLNPSVGIVGAGVIISWAYQLIGDTVSPLLDLSPDPALNDKICQLVESDGQTAVQDLHVWKLGPGKLGVVLSVETNVRGRDCEFYYSKLRWVRALAHITIEVCYSKVEEYGQACAPAVLAVPHGHSLYHSRGSGRRSKDGTVAYAPLHTFTEL